MRKRHRLGLFSAPLLFFLPALAAAAGLLASAPFIGCRLWQVTVDVDPMSSCCLVTPCAIICCSNLWLISHPAATVPESVKDNGATTH